LFTKLKKYLLFAAKESVCEKDLLWRPGGLENRKMVHKLLEGLVEHLHWFSRIDERLQVS
jgi:hypothetical protein